jgi:hypothetical protein
LSLCSIALLPRGFHQSAASAPKCRASSGLIVVSGLLAISVLAHYSGAVFTGEGAAASSPSLTANGYGSKYGAHRDEIRRHLDGGDGANPPRRQYRASNSRRQGHEVAVVVSAMAGETDRLVGFCREANPLYDPAEYDVVVARASRSRRACWR